MLTLDELAAMRYRAEQDMAGNRNYPSAYNIVQLIDELEATRDAVGVSEAHVRQLLWQHRRATEEIERGDIAKGLAYIKHGEVTGD